MRRASLFSLAVLVGSIMVALVAGGSGARASDAPAPKLLVIRSASLVQQGQELRLQITAAETFRLTQLHRDHISLCLLLERSRGAVAAEACLEPARTGHRALRLERFTAQGRGRFVRATVTRPSSRSLLARFRPAAIDESYRSFHWQLRSARRAAVAIYPARPRLVRLHVPRLVGCVPTGASLRFSGPTNDHDIALSFDDGPWPEPPSIDFVKLLARLHVPATFFEIGDQISEYDRTGAVERLMLADGDMIGDHTWTHPDMLQLSAPQQTAELEQTVHAIEHATGFTPCLWRPPYGDTDPQLEALARRLGMLTIMWDIDPRDWSEPGVASIERTVIDNAQNGGIVEMHFGGGPRYETLDALPDIVSTLRRRGYHFVNIAQMLGLRLVYR